MWNLRCGRDEAVQDDGDCKAKTRNLQNSLSVCEQKIKRVDSKPIVWRAFWRERGRLAAKGGGMSPYRRVVTYGQFLLIEGDPTTSTDPARAADESLQQVVKKTRLACAGIIRRDPRIPWLEVSLG